QGGQLLLDGRSKAREIVRRGKVVRDSRLGTGGDRQYEVHALLSYHPDSCLPWSFAEEFKSRHGRQLWLCRKRDDAFFAQRFRETFGGPCHFAEKCRGLLPFTFRIDVTVVAVAEAEHIKQVALRAITLHQRLPRGIVGGSQLRQRRRAKLRMPA